MDLALDFITEQVNGFDPEWRARIIDEAISAESGDTQFNAIVSVSGSILWVLASATDDSAVEATGYWNPKDGTFLGGVSNVTSTSKGPGLLAVAGVAESLWTLLEQLVDSLPIKTAKRMEA